MRFKVLPEPADSPKAVEEMQAAVPLVPDGETSCCARLMDRTDVASQDRAKEWLTFLRALKLVEETEGKYRRLPVEADPDALRRAFRERVYLADEALSVLSAADGPVEVEAAYERLDDRVPRWEQLRRTDADGVWRERVRRVLEWAVLLGLAERAEGGYVAG
jgi:hypothetical protein